MKNLLIALIGILGFNACTTTAKMESPYANNIEEVESLLQSTDLSANYNGAILIADGERVLYEEAYGFNNLNNETNGINSTYDLASMGKMFTAVAIMQLIEREQISLTQTIGELLPDYPNDEAKSIIVRQLLSHTSGLGDFFGPAFFENQESVTSLEDYLPFFANDPLGFEPGETMRYSNAGYIVLGLMIEELTGENFSSFITENIFIPAGMTSTGPLVSSAGGGKSTVTDLHKFALALQNNTLISEDSFSSMTTDHFNHGYGYGMSLRDLNGIKVYGHNGGAPGISGELDMVMGEALIIATMSNRSPLEGWAQVRNNIRKEFFGSTPEIEQFLNTEQVAKTYIEQGFDEASRVLEQLNNNISDRDIFRYAERYMNEGQPDRAIEVMKLIVQAYSDQWYPYSFLADFQLQAGYKEEAIENYKKSLELNPQNEQALEQLRNLGQMD